MLIGGALSLYNYCTRKYANYVRAQDRERIEPTPRIKPTKIPPKETNFSLDQYEIIKHVVYKNMAPELFQCQTLEEVEALLRKEESDALDRTSI
jgi:hypothetical protein